MFTVYALISEKTRKIYIGQTIDIEVRLKQHNSSGEEHLGKFTRNNQGPWKLIYEEKHETRKEALRRER